MVRQPKKLDYIRKKGKWYLSEQPENIRAVVNGATIKYPTEDQVTYRSKVERDINSVSKMIQYIET